MGRMTGRVGTLILHFNLHLHFKEAFRLEAETSGLEARAPRRILRREGNVFGEGAEHCGRGARAPRTGILAVLANS